MQGLLGPKKELWDLLQKIEKLDGDAADITASVRDLPTVRTAVGRARAWLRLALMQVWGCVTAAAPVNYFRHLDNDNRM